jgi:hypothetical protein
MFSPVESQVIFLSKETLIVSVGLRTAEVSYTKQNCVKIPKSYNCWECLSEYHFFKRRIQWQNMLRTHLLQSRIFRGRIPVPPAYQRGGNPLWHSTLPLLQFFLRTLHEYNNNVSSNVLLKPTLGQKKYICAFTVTCQKNLVSVGRD